MARKNSGNQPSGMAIPVRYLNHNARPLEAQGTSLVHGALNYLQAHAGYYHLTADDINKMGSPLEGKFTDEKSSYRLEAHKDFMDTITFVFVQTYFGLPVWEAGISVSILKTRKRILSSLSSAYDDITVTNPGKAVFGRSVEAPALYKALGLEKEAKSAKRSEISIESERALIYRYEPQKRTIVATNSDEIPRDVLESEFVLPLPPVPDSIKNGAFYVVKEIIFKYPLPGAPGLVWRAFIEPETNTVLYLRAFGSNATGMVFQKDPITKGSGLTPSASDAALNALRDSITFQNLNPPSGGVQALTGSLVSVAAVEAPAVTSPTPGSPYIFNYNARTNNFAAANTYYHCNYLFQTILDMGFGSAYFNGTSFPVHCDHRGLNQPNTGETGIGIGGSADLYNVINAHCLGNTTGITSVDFALADLSDITFPVTSAEITGDHLGIACDGRVSLHELGGHGVLYCHVGSANYGFSHSAGDSVATITNDPGSLAPDRFASFPFTFLSLPAGAARRHDRTPAAGWGWNGTIGLNPFNLSLDYAGYNNEQILSTTLFRLYRSIGGDAADLNMQLFASRFAVYLIFKAISTLTPTTNPQNALAFEQAMETGDASDWVSLNPAETQAGGAYWKVIRWAFEKQGLFQLPGTATPNNNIGSPPPVDVYIDDDRQGEYTYQPNHWSCQDIWNRTSPGDGGGVHQDPIIGQTNYAYVRVKNRGYQAATNIVVKGFHCFPGVGLEYPTDWMHMDTPQLNAPDLAASDNVGEVVGPFNWVPSQIGHECLFFSVSAQGNAADSTTQDFSNIESRVVGPIPEWRLVPNDNNIAQRNVAPVASGFTGLAASFQDRPFWIRNSFDRDVRTEVIIKLPEILERNKWHLSLASEGGQSFFLKKGERKKVTLKMLAGHNFDIKGEAAHQQIQVTVKQDGITVGGMVYYIDPKTEYPHNGLGGHGKSGMKDAAGLLKHLDLSKAKIKSITVRKINIDIDFEEGDEC